jgi:methylmalonyl-CoA mutase cobalamin-binding domain/chain
VEELLGARLSHCFGNLFSDPILRIIFLMAMNEINTKHAMGSMLYGNTIDFSADYDRNYGALCSFVLADTCGQMLFPTGHAVTPIPITEAIRIPSADEIIQVHVTANMLETKAKHYQAFLDIEKMTAEKDTLIKGGKVFFERVMNGLDELGIDTRNPNELFMALKALGPARLEEHFGAGQADPNAMRGHIPIKPTDIVWTIGQKKDQICKNIGGLEHSLDNVNAIVGATDVHEFGKEIVKAVLLKAGMHIFDLGANVEPQEIVDTAIETESKFILISTFNGIALTYGKTLLDCLKKAGLHEVVIMGGLLNENMDGESLPVDVTDKLEGIGVYCSKNADELVDMIKSRL